MEYIINFEFTSIINGRARQEYGTINIQSSETPDEIKNNIELCEAIKENINKKTSEGTILLKITGVKSV